MVIATRSWHLSGRHQKHSLLEQITTNSGVENNADSLSYNSGGQKSKLNPQGWFLLEALGKKPVFLPFPPSRGRLHSKAGGPRPEPHRQGRQPCLTSPLSVSIITSTFSLTETLGSDRTHLDHPGQVSHLGILSLNHICKGFTDTPQRKITEG